MTGTVSPHRPRVNGACSPPAAAARPTAAGVPDADDEERTELRALHTEADETMKAATALQAAIEAENASRTFGIVTADTIAEEDVSFLSERPAIIENTVNLVEGNPDTGKTLVVLDVAACVTAGRRFPFRSARIRPRNVLFLTCEDSLSTTIVKRLRAADADLARVLVQKPTKAELLLPGALDSLRPIVRHKGIGLLVLDPLNGYLDASEIDVNKEQEVRQALRPVRNFAEEEGVTVIALRHLNKASDKPAMYRGGGSIALTAVARSTLLVARHPEDPALRVVVVQKCNELPDSNRVPIAFRIGQDRHGRPRVEWLPDAVEIDADELLGPRKPGPKPDTLDNAKRYLRDHLADGPKKRSDVLHGALRVRLDEKVMERAARDLGCLSVPNPDNRKERMWSLPT